MPLALAVLVVLVDDNLATGFPDAVFLISGSLPQFPKRITVLTHLLIELAFPATSIALLQAWPIALSALKTNRMAGGLRQAEMPETIFRPDRAHSRG